MFKAMGVLAKIYILKSSMRALSTIPNLKCLKKYTTDENVNISVYDHNPCLNEVLAQLQMQRPQRSKLCG